MSNNNLSNTNTSLPLRKGRAWLYDLLAILFFVALSFAYFLHPVSEGLVLTGHDHSGGAGAASEMEAYHAAHNYAERTRWTNTLFSGMPTYQMAPSYSSTDRLAKEEDIYKLFLPDYVVLVFVMLLGFYILLRAFDFKVWMAALGAVLWAFSSYYFIIIGAGHIWKFYTLAFIPPTIAGMVLCYRGRYGWGLLVTAFFMALQIHSNHVQMTYYFAFVIALMALAYLFEALQPYPQLLPSARAEAGAQTGNDMESAGRTSLRGGFKGWLVSTLSFALGCLIGIAINASNLYHTWEYSKETMRGKSELTQHPSAGSSATGGLDKEYITQWSYGVDETLTLLVPNFKGGASEAISQNKTAMTKANPRYSSLYGSISQYFGTQPGTSGPVYVGAFVLFLFLMGCFIVKGPMKWALLGATVFSIVLSWGKNFMPVTDFFIDYVPMYNKFRAVSSILVIAEFSIPLLAMLALKKMIGSGNTIDNKLDGNNNYQFSIINYQFLVPLFLTVGLSLLIWFTPATFTDLIPAQEAQMLQSAVDQGGIPANELAGIMGNISEMRAAMVSADALRSLIIVIIGIAILLLFKMGKLRKEVTIGAIVLLCLIDMWQINKRYLYDDLFVDKSIRTTSFAQTEADKYILEDTDLDYRVLNFAVSSFNENNTSYWHKNVGGYHAAKLRRYNELIETRLKAEMQDAFQAIAEAGGDMEQVDPANFHALNMLNTRYFILPTKEGQLPLENPYALGNGWFVKEVSYVANADEELDKLASSNPHVTAVVDEQFKSALNNASSFDVNDDATIELTAYEPNSLTYETTNPSDGVAVFSEVYYPDGWQVTIDGEPVELARADYVLRTLYVPAGHHTIQMTFDPQSIHVTEAIAYAAMCLLLLGAIAVIFFYYKKNRQPN